MIIQQLGLKPYSETQIAMQEFVAGSDADTPDELWFVEHPAVYTQGTACDLPTLTPSDIPLVKSDRGGQITYHGPGQVVMYVLLNLKRHGLGVKALVDMLEQTIIDVLDGYHISANRKDGAPGVYVDEAKIGALGLRFRKGFSYHGLSLNVDMDLQPFLNIDPCGYKDMPVTQIKDQLHLLGEQVIKEIKQPTLGEVQQALNDKFISLLNEVTEHLFVTK